MHRNLIKTICLLFVLLVLTGCNAEYNLDISDNKIVESTNIYAEESDLDIIDEDGFAIDNPFSNVDDFIDYNYSIDYRAFNYNFNNESNYEKAKINDSNGQGINLRYTYDFENFENSYFLNKYFSENSYTINDRFIIIDLNDFNGVYYLNSGNSLNNLAINIKTNLKVLENNADSVNGNVYTWNIDSENASEKKVYIKIKKKFNYMSIIIGISVVFSLGLIIALIVFYIRRKNIESNSF